MQPREGNLGSRLLARSDGISDPHFGQSLGALIIGGESLTRSLSFLLRKMLSEVTPGLQQLNREAHPRLPFAALWCGATPIYQQNFAHSRLC
jgi:hypothetical protein